MSQQGVDLSLEEWGHDYIYLGTMPTETLNIKFWL